MLNYRVQSWFYGAKRCKLWTSGGMRLSTNTGANVATYFLLLVQFNYAAVCDDILYSVIPCGTKGLDGEQVGLKISAMIVQYVDDVLFALLRVLLHAYNLCLQTSHAMQICNWESI